MLRRTVVPTRIIKNNNEYTGKPDMNAANPYEEDYDKASEYLRLTLPLLAKCSIPPSPLNFRMGYEHVTGRNPEFRRELEKVIDGADKPNDDALWNLYRRFFLQGEADLEVIRRELQQVINSLRIEFEHSNGSLAAYSDTLQNFSNVLESAPPDRIPGELKKVLADTRDMEYSHEHLREQMSELAAEVETLRHEIEQAREEALTDPLTGISNRKAFDAALERTLQQSAETGSPFSLLLADVDHFKKFNDTYGHLVGDKVLRFVAGALKRSVKGADTTARYGGEEFAVILPDTDLRGGMTVAEQIRKAISSGKLRDSSKGDIYGKVTVSLGVCTYDGSGTAADLIDGADQALYRAKNNGRNRVEACPD